MIFLSSADLFEMTGYRSLRRQRQWLADNGYQFDVRSDGRPNVLIRQVLERQCTSVTQTKGPDLAWMDEPPSV